MKLANIFVSLTVFVVAVCGIYGTRESYPLATHQSFRDADEMGLTRLSGFHISE